MAPRIGKNRVFTRDMIGALLEASNKHKGFLVRPSRSARSIKTMQKSIGSDSDKKEAPCSSKLTH